MRNQIKEKLMQIDNKVYYGMLPPSKAEEDWNFLVMAQKSIRKKRPESTDLQGYWSVAIFRETFIPDELVFDVIEAMESIPGLRLADSECEYEYLQKGNTDIVIEALELRFTKTKKRDK